ncbi:sushi, von Willebrand factor type A, EGF and pentraxin domain-containing protein 1-like [Mercenaria mercenaria]|uniref:sushi, von Willebrand factor type A, EGF and pentraxin domain-containing protein 1-like n=1 Tax=Mercenaria mercenaria TaxID=6596 RepID=UPI00234F6E85|nr:sushi, von Willebrand factor type A, EGF and pentraxin domain-containing protein 1-like [Mercenaria mercenaria]
MSQVQGGQHISDTGQSGVIMHGPSSCTARMLIPSSKGCPLLTPSHSCSWKIIVGGRSRFGEFNTVGSIIQLWKVSSTASVFMYCQSDGTYNTPSDCVTVSKVGCVAPSKPLQTYLHFSPGDPWFSVGRAVRYFCDNPGYELKGNTTRTCITSNIWSGQLPTCKLKTEGCQYPGSFDNGYYTDSTEQIYNYGVNPINEVIVAYCHKTFSLHNQPAESTCQSGGVWSGGNPHCVLVTCGPLNPPSNAFYLFMNGSQYSYGKLPFGTNIYLKCGEMFHSVGNIYSLCQSDGTWSNRNHSCMHVTCKEPNLVTNGGYFTSNNSRYTGWNVNVNTHIYGFCEVGYFSPHNLSRTCTANGSWSGVAPSCSRITCRPPSAYNNGGYYLNFGNFSKFSVFQLNASIFVECHTGFTITTSAHRQCILIDNSGKWSGEDPVCSTVTRKLPINM